jgi:hypothetical protein
MCRHTNRVSRYTNRMHRYTSRMSRYTNRMSRYTSRMSRYTNRMSRYTNRMSRYTNRMHRYTSRVSRYTNRIDNLLRYIATTGGIGYLMRGSSKENISLPCRPICPPPPRSGRIMHSRKLTTQARTFDCDLILLNKVGVDFNTVEVSDSGF